eukprot:763793-Hanusia_phi.AAC.4
MLAVGSCCAAGTRSPDICVAAMALMATSSAANEEPALKPNHPIHWVAVSRRAEKRQGTPVRRLLERRGARCEEIAPARARAIASCRRAWKQPDLSLRR